MRVWLDMNNSPHPLLLRPIAERLQERGAEILVTARDTARHESSLSPAGPRQRSSGPPRAPPGGERRR